MIKYKTICKIYEKTTDKDIRTIAEYVIYCHDRVYFGRKRIEQWQRRYTISTEYAPPYMYKFYRHNVANEIRTAKAALRYMQHTYARAVQSFVMACRKNPTAIFSKGARNA